MEIIQDILVDRGEDVPKPIKENQHKKLNSENSHSGDEIYYLVKEMNQTLDSIKTTLDFFKALVIIQLVLSFIAAFLLFF